MQIECMQNVGDIPRIPQLPQHFRQRIGEGPEFDISPVLSLYVSPDMLQQPRQVGRVPRQRIAVVGKREGHNSGAREPTPDPAEDKPVRENFAWLRRSQNEGVVPITDLQCFQPARTVKCAGLRMFLNEIRPAGILQRIYFAYGRYRLYRPRRIDQALMNRWQGLSLKSFRQESGSRPCGDGGSPREGLKLL